MAQKVDARGGKGSKQWDDGTEHDGVTKIYIQVGRNGIQDVKFIYVQNGQLKEGPVHCTTPSHGQTSISPTFEIDHPEEYLVSVEGTYYEDNGVIQALKFKTNKKSSCIFGYDDGAKFSLEAKDKKIIGFHGSSESNLNSLGAYFVSASPSSASLPSYIKVEAQGGINGGTPWDDGAHDDIRKVYVGQGDSSVTYLKFEYEKGGKIEARDHGKKTLLDTEEFELGEDEYITSVEVFHDKIFSHECEVITSLIFNTSKGRTSQPFGLVAGTKSVLDGKGAKLVGFHGYAGDAIHALGAYFATSSTPSSRVKKIVAQGGDAGHFWDDGIHDGVRKVYVGQGDSSVVYVKFEYEKGSKPILGPDHGKQTLLGAETFEIDYPSEYIIAVEAYYEKIYGASSEVITSIRFKTNKQTSQPYGIESGTKFVLEEKGSKIVGFYGKASDKLHKFGAYAAPITN